MPTSRELLLKLASRLSRRRIRQLLLLGFVTLASAAAELISLGSVLPFLSVLTSPELFWENSLVQQFALVFGWTSPSQLLIPAAMLFGSTAVLAGGLRLLNLWLNGRLSAAIGSDISSDAFRRTIFQSYEAHARRNSSTLIHANTVQVSKVTSATSTFLIIVTSACVACSLVIGLLVIDWSVAVISATFFGIAYLLIVSNTKRKLISNGSEIVLTGQRNIKIIQESLGGIRDVLLFGAQDVYFSNFSSSDRLMRRLSADNSFISQFPRYALEALGLLLVAFLAIILVIQKGGAGAAVPFLGAFALGAQRLLPALQQLYMSWSKLKAMNADLAGALELLEQPLPAKLKVANPFAFQRSICFSNVNFNYVASGSTNVIQDLNLTIVSGERIGILGGTGSGKSTTIDLLMGLLEPTGGKILIDGLNLHDSDVPERLLAWRAAVSHVPQAIYLSDSSVAQNIAFGISPGNIDYEKVKIAAEKAQISAFIEAMDDGYDTFVGERGVRLSGGQRQRIGIARALYRNCSLLVLDEATSALDDATESAVIESINDLESSLTIVMIAHRLSTLSKCDRIIRLAQGSVIDEGKPYDVIPRIS